jgi:hypothetical protein
MLTIREGFYYRNRKGEKIGPMRRNADPCMQHPWIATEKEGGIEHYKNHGGWHWDDAQQSQYDLIAEWPEQPEPTTGEPQITHFVPHVPSVDLVQHELAELRKAVARLAERYSELEYSWTGRNIEIEKLIAERDRLREQVTELQQKCSELKQIAGKGEEQEEWRTPTDEDAKQRPKVEVSQDEQRWYADYTLLAVIFETDFPFKTVNPGKFGCTSGWKFARIRIEAKAGPQ